MSLTVRPVVALSVPSPGWPTLTFKFQIMFFSIMCRIPVKSLFEVRGWVVILLLVKRLLKNFAKKPW